MRLNGKTQAQVDAEALAAAGKAAKEKALSDLAANDLAAIRCLLAVAAGTAVKEDYDKLKMVDSNAQALRAQLQEAADV